MLKPPEAYQQPPPLSLTVPVGPELVETVYYLCHCPLFSWVTSTTGIKFCTEIQDVASYGHVFTMWGDTGHVLFQISDEI